MNKKDVCKLKPGAIVEVVWKDAPPERAIVLEKPEYSKGTISVKLFYPATGEVNWGAMHSQIATYLGQLTLPERTLPEDARYPLPVTRKAKAKPEQAQLNEV